MAIRSDVETTLEELSRRSGIPRGELSKRYHRIKRHGASFGAEDDNFIDDANGDVYDAIGGVPGDYIGNVFDDF